MAAADLAEERNGGMASAAPVSPLHVAGSNGRASIVLLVCPLAVAAPAAAVCSLTTAEAHWQEAVNREVCPRGTPAHGGGPLVGVATSGAGPDDGGGGTGF